MNNQQASSSSAEARHIGLTNLSVIPFFLSHFFFLLIPFIFFGFAVRSLPYVNPPSSSLTSLTTNKRSIRVFWLVAGYVAILTHVETLVDGLIKIPWLSNHLSTFYVLIPLFLFAVILYSVAVIAFTYIVCLSHLLPSKPLGCHAKHGFELVALFAAVILQWFRGYDLYNHVVFSVLIVEFHAYCQFRYHSVDLSYADWFLQELMQVAVYLSGKNWYAIVAITVGSLMVIGYRFHSYSCLEASDLRVGFTEKLEAENT